MRNQKRPKELPYSKLEVWYIFNDKKYCLRNANNEIIGWKDLSGNNNHMYFKR